MDSANRNSCLTKWSDFVYRIDIGMILRVIPMSYVFYLMNRICVYWFSEYLFEEIFCLLENVL